MRSRVRSHFPDRRKPGICPCRRGTHNFPSEIPHTDFHKISAAFPGDNVDDTSHALGTVEDGTAPLHDFDALDVLSADSLQIVLAAPVDRVSVEQDQRPIVYPADDGFVRHRPHGRAGLAKGLEREARHFPQYHGQVLPTCFRISSRVNTSVLAGISTSRRESLVAVTTTWSSVNCFSSSVSAVMAGSAASTLPVSRNAITTPNGILFSVASAITPFCFILAPGPCPAPLCISHRFLPRPQAERERLIGIATYRPPVPIQPWTEPESAGCRQGFLVQCAVPRRTRQGQISTPPSLPIRKRTTAVPSIPLFRADSGYCGARERVTRGATAGPG